LGKVNRKGKVVRQFNELNGQCPYCREKMTLELGYRKTATIDHIKPTSKGGARDAFNEVVCCSECNTLKGDKPLHEFLVLLHVRKMALA
jgi:5-methylcytosine-specific restriction endonuclease McrA